MKNLILFLAVLLLPAVGWATHADANDDSDTAAEHASCNANFQHDCLEEATISSSAVAAPIGIVGGGSIETLALILLLGGTLGVRIARPGRPNCRRNGA